MKDVQQHLSPEELKALEDPEAYLGSARAFQKRLLASSGQDHAKRQKG